MPLDEPDELDPPPTHPSWYVNRTVTGEARRTLDAQRAWLSDIDQKAMRTLRFNTVLLGLLVPGFSYAVRYNLVDSPTAFYNRKLAAGITLLVLSIALAGLTYTSSSIRIGISATDISRARQNGFDDPTIHDALVDSYERWIRSNRRMLFWNSLLVNATVVSMVAGLSLLVLGTALAFDAPVPDWVYVATYGGIGLLAALSQLL